MSAIMDLTVEIIELESKLKAEKTKRDIYEEEIARRRDLPKCSNCAKIEDKIAELKKENDELELQVKEARIKNARGAGRKHVLDDKQKKAIAYQKNSGLNVNEIAMMYGVSVAVIYKAIKEAKEIK